MRSSGAARSPSAAAQSALDALAAIVARTAAFDPLRAVAPAVEKLGGRQRPRRGGPQVGRARGALLAGPRAAARGRPAPPPLKDWKLTVDLGLHELQFKEAEEFFADPVRDKRHAPFGTTTTTRTHAEARLSCRSRRIYGAADLVRGRAGQRPHRGDQGARAARRPEDIRARVKSASCAPRTSPRSARWRPSSPRPRNRRSAAAADGDRAEPEKKKQRALARVSCVEGRVVTMRPLIEPIDTVDRYKHSARAHQCTAYNETCVLWATPASTYVYFFFLRTCFGLFASATGFLPLPAAAAPTAALGRRAAAPAAPLALAAAPVPAAPAPAARPNGRAAHGVPTGTDQVAVVPQLTHPEPRPPPSEAARTAAL